MSQRLFLTVIIVTTLLAGCAPAIKNRKISFGIEMAQKGLWQEAAYRWQGQLEAHGPTAALLNNLAIAAESAGDFQEAERLYAEALKMSPGNPVILENQKLFLKLKAGNEPEEDKEDRKMGGKVQKGERR